MLLREYPHNRDYVPMTENSISSRIGGQRPLWTLEDRLRKAREHAGMDQRAIAAALGIGHSTIGNYERGITQPKRPVLLAWAMATGVDLEWITGDDNGPTVVDGGADVVRHQGLEPRTRCLVAVA